MHRFIPRTLALACIALTLSACNASGLTSTDVASLATAAATTAPTLPPSAVVSQVLASAGVTPAGQKQVTKYIAAAQQTCKNFRDIKPIASGLLNVGIALSPSLAALTGSGAAQELGSAVTFTCNALASAPTYAALGNRRGEFVKATVHINGLDVPVYGIRTR